MKYYPVCLNINGRNCLVVGGGSVGTRKVETLLRCGARVTVISQSFTPVLRALSESNQVTLREKAYDASDLTSMFLVFGATDNRILNDAIRRDAERLNALFNSADDPESSCFVLPAVVERGDLTIAVSTAGNSPAFARKIKKDLDGQFGPEYAEFLRIMGAIRKKLLAETHDPKSHKDLFERLIASGLLDELKNENLNAVNELVNGVLGPGYGYDELLGKKEDEET